MAGSEVSERTLNRLGIVSLLFGGFLLIAFAGIFYSVFWQGEFRYDVAGPRRAILVTDSLNRTNVTLPELAHARLPPDARTAVVLSPPVLFVLLCGLVFLANGYFLLRYVRQHERRQTHKDAVWSILTPDEKSAMSALEGRGGELTQKELSLLLGFSAVKAHRVLQRLEEKKLVQTHPFGMTKKVLLSKSEKK